jgi:hypothetical protein
LEKCRKLNACNKQPMKGGKICCPVVIVQRTKVMAWTWGRIMGMEMDLLGLAVHLLLLAKFGAGGDL